MIRNFRISTSFMTAFVHTFYFCFVLFGSLFLETGPKFIAPDLCDDENGESKYSVQSFLLSPEEMKPMHIWTNVDSTNGEQALDMNMFNRLSEAGIIVGSRIDVPNGNIDAILQNTINENIIRKFADSLGCGDIKESACILRNLFEKIKSLIGLVEQSPQHVFRMAVNALSSEQNNGIETEINGNNETTEIAWAVNQSIDLHLMDIISKTVVDCLNCYANGKQSHENGQRQKHTNNPLLYEIISKTLANNLNLYLKNATIDGNSLSQAELCFNAIEKLLAAPEKVQQIEKNVTLLVAKSMNANKVDLIKAMINGMAETEKRSEFGTEPQHSDANIHAPQSQTPHNQNVTDLLENICVLLQNETVDELRDSVRNLIRHEPSMMHHILTEMHKQTDNLINEHTIVDTLRKCIVSAVQKLANDDIKQIVSTPGPHSAEKLSTYLTDTIQLARALGFTDCILNMSNIMSGNGDVIDQIEANAKTFELLQRVIVMHKLAQNDKVREKALESLRHDPYTARSDNVLRELLRCSGICTINVEESIKITDSNDVPISLIYSQNQLAIEEFFLRTQTKPRGAFLIVKDRFQAVVPRESSRDVLTGKCAYTVLDENGIRHFEPLHMFTALKLKNVTMFEDRFASYLSGNGNEKLNNNFDIDIDHILNMGAITTASSNGFIAYKSTILPKKDLEIFTKRRPTPPHGLIFDRNQVNYRRSFYL